MNEATQPLLLPPGPKRRFPGDMLIRSWNGAIPFFRDTAREFGDVAYYRVSGHSLYLLSHPDHVYDALVVNAAKFVKGRGLEKARMLFGQGLLTSDGEYHDRQRRLVQPALHRLRVAEFAETMTACAEKACEAWEDGKVMDINREMTRLAMSIAGKTLFGTDIEPEADDIGQAFTDAIELFDTVMKPFAGLLDRLPFGRAKRLHRGRALLDATIYKVIRERRASGKNQNDVLSRMLSAVETGGDAAMTDEQLRDECMTIFLAGHETVATALTWTWYLLGRNPDARERLETEIDEVVGSRIPTWADVPRLKFTEMALAESMRLYPPVWMLDRRVTEPYTVAGYTCPVDSIVVISPYVIHHDERFFPDPERFQPERWTKEGRASRPRFSYFPFGAGPRQCIGETFAWTEGVLILATIARRWRLEPDTAHRVEMAPTVTLRPKGGVRVIPRAR